MIYKVLVLLVINTRFLKGRTRLRENKENWVMNKFKSSFNESPQSPYDGGIPKKVNACVAFPRHSFSAES